MVNFLGMSYPFWLSLMRGMLPIHPRHIFLISKIASFLMLILFIFHCTQDATAAKCTFFHLIMNF